MMETQTMLLENVSAMPASTWRFLKMNETQIEIPAGLTISPAVEIEGACRRGGAGEEFAQALVTAQAEWEALHPAPTAEELAEREAFLAAEADATYGGTAQSDYQMSADALEDMRSLAAAFEHGLGDETAAYLRYAAGEHVVVEAAPSQEVQARITVTAAPGAISIAAIDVIAGRGSSIALSILVDAPVADATSAASGIAGTALRVFADADAHVSIERMQTLSDGFADIDDAGLFAHDRAHINVRQTVLGADASFSGWAGDLRGDQSRVRIDTRYLGSGTQKRDFNYSLRHHGTRSTCDLTANGVLAGKSAKILRGTIDLVRGCKGAQGSENETVLLIDEGVRNKTVPVILCNEDDVAGNHGATIGHIRAEQLFYLASRGLSQEAAEALFASAIVEQAALEAGTPATRAAAIRLGERMTPGFAERFDEEE